jgi:uroporphyrinogen-III synthase
MEALILRYQGRPFVAPSVVERAIETNEDLLVHTGQLIAGAFDMVVLMTGTGLAYWRDASVTRYAPDDFVSALARTTLVSRGPKPVVVLHQMGLKAQVQVPEPNTWQEMVPLIAARSERRIAIQEYGRGNPEFVAALESLGGEVTPICIYRWELPADTGPLREAARRIAQRDCDVVVFTTSVQLTHLLEIAAAEGLEQEVRRSLEHDVVIASVGPIMDAALVAQNLKPDIVPPHPKMGILLRAAAENAYDALTLKRGATPLSSS